jgi:hypothetical protein
MAKTKNSSNVAFHSVRFAPGEDVSLEITFIKNGRRVTFKPTDRDLFTALYHRGMIVEMFPSFRVREAERWNLSSPVPEEVFLTDVSVVSDGASLSFDFAVSAGHPHLVLGTDCSIETERIFPALKEAHERARA